MKLFFATAALLTVRAYSQSCDANSPTSGQAVNGITFTNVGGSGSYNRVTNMDNSTGQCSSTPYQYSGLIAPFNEELSVHIRGPIQLKSFAVYVPGSSSGTDPETRSTRTRRHTHGHKHGHRHTHHHKRQWDEAPTVATITAAYDGNPFTWTTTFGETATNEAAPPASPTAVENQEKPQTTVEASTVESTPSEASTPVESGQTSIPSGSPSRAGWTRTAYYSAEDGTSDGLVFLNHNGGQGSGVFDDTFGLSLSYATSNGMAGSATAQTLADTTLPSNAEVVIMTDQPCGANGGSCGYYRPGTVAYHGFNGADKVFFFQFMMPDDTAGAAANGNMPAVWFLNANIPRTIQYPQADQVDCSCDETGCGEFDAFEVLQASCSAATTTIHGNKAEGASNYFGRPASTYTTLAVVMSGDSFHIVTMDPNMDFADGMSESHVTQIVQQGTSDASSYSLADAGPG